MFYTDKGAHVENKAGGTEPTYAASRRLLSMAGVKVGFQHELLEKLEMFLLKIRNEIVLFSFSEVKEVQMCDS